LFPAMTLGCGAAGGNITSDNISPLHLINLRRIAYEARPVTQVSSVQLPAHSSTASCVACATSEETGRQKPETSVGVNWSVARAVDRFLAGKQGGSSTAISGGMNSAATQTSAKEASGTQSGASSASQAGKSDGTQAAAPAPKPRAVDFVSEAEIRAAMKHKSKIFVGKKTIITPAARDLAAEYDVLVRVD